MITADSLADKYPEFDSDELAKTMEEVSLRLLSSVHTNFNAGGRPAIWQMLKTGKPSHLYKTGNLYNSIQPSSGEDWAEVGVDRTTAPYCFAQNFGYAPRNLPERPYMIFQEEDIKWITDRLRDHFVQFITPKKK